MISKEDILKLAKIKKKIKSQDVVVKFNVSRQYVSFLIRSLIQDNKLIKIGSTNSAYYILPELYKETGLFPSRIFKRLTNRKLREHEIFDQIQAQYPPIKQLTENVKAILDFAFSEMLNNAIEHSKSKNIEVEISMQNRKLIFVVNDFGIGVFRNVMKKKKLKTEIEAMQDLLKGKTTTASKFHSGEGIFFTSKVGDVFTLESFGFSLVINNKTHEIFFQKPPALKRGTKVKFTIDVNSSRHLSSIFRRFTDADFGFSKTEIKVRLYTSGEGVHVSRSQARRILHGLDKFSSVILDFDKVPIIGQGFADEIFRVFKNKYPNIKIQPINMNDAVQFMINRVAKE